jgi:hypothetical protein
MRRMSFLEAITLLGVVGMLSGYLALAMRFAEGSARDGRRG